MQFFQFFSSSTPGHGRLHPATCPTKETAKSGKSATKTAYSPETLQIRTTTTKTQTQTDGEDTLSR